MVTGEVMGSDHKTAIMDASSAIILGKADLSFLNET
jgi:hypothetical protein